MRQQTNQRYVRYMDDFVIMAPTRHKRRRAIKEVHAVMDALGLRRHATKRYIGKLNNGFDFLGYRVVPGRRLRTSAEGRRRCAEKFRRLYEQGAAGSRLWRYAERGCRWQRAGLDGLVSLKGGLRRVVIRQLKMLGIVGFPIPRYEAQIGTWQTRKTSASG
jgi:RNA-directed DNA polymerase